jgi:transcriptional regulator with XRE-family HTH domain
LKKGDTLALVLSSLGGRLKQLRQRGGLSQEQLAVQLSGYGFRISRERISEIELGRVSPISRLTLEIWLRQCGANLNDTEVRALLEYRELAQWFQDLRNVVPNAISWKEFQDLGVVISDLASRDPGDIRATRHLLQRQIAQYLDRRVLRTAEAEVQDKRSVKRKSQRQGRFSDLYGIWKGKVNLSYEEIRGAEIRLRDEL